LVREQYYIDWLKPEYNILSAAGSSYGYKHTLETLDKLKLRVLSAPMVEARANLAASATGRVLSSFIQDSFRSWMKARRPELKYLQHYRTVVE
jgi:hypothetical protein